MDVASGCTVLSLERIRSTILVAEAHAVVFCSRITSAIPSRTEPGSAPLSNALSNVYVNSLSQILMSFPEKFHGSFPALLFCYINDCRHADSEKPHVMGSKRTETASSQSSAVSIHFSA